MNAISDEGLLALAKLPQLTDLWVLQTEVTDAGLEKLRRARPNLRVRPAYAISGITAFAQAGDFESVKRILDRDPAMVDFHDPRFIKTTPLHHALDHYEITRLLLDRGAKVDATTTYGYTPLQSAAGAYWPNHRVIRLLLARGANVNHADHEGNTILHYAARAGTGQLMPFLLAVGANPFTKNLQGKLPIEMGSTLDDKIRNHLLRFMALTKDPVPMAKLTSASCDRLAYTLQEGQASGWTSHKSGAFHGPLQWSRAPSGKAFFGPFSQQMLTLGLNDLPKHNNVTIELELVILGSWDGNGDGAGPDIIDISVPGVGTLLHSTFFNNNEGDRANLPLQSFPDPYPSGFHKAYTGAAEVRTLGYVQNYPRDAVYKLTFTFAHDGSALDLRLSGLTVPQPQATQMLQDETWGIRSLAVRTD
jgi:hypothetical protein